MAVKSTLTRPRLLQNQVNAKTIEKDVKNTRYAHRPRTDRDLAEQHLQR